jgi:hypothetical protein
MPGQGETGDSLLRIDAPYVNLNLLSDHRAGLTVD